MSQLSQLSQLSQPSQPSQPNEPNEPMNPMSQCVEDSGSPAARSFGPKQTNVLVELKIGTEPRDFSIQDPDRAEDGTSKRLKCNGMKPFQRLRALATKPNLRPVVQHTGLLAREETAGGQSTTTVNSPMDLKPLAHETIPRTRPNLCKADPG